MAPSVRSEASDNLLPLPTQSHPYSPQQNTNTNTHPTVTAQTISSKRASKRYSTYSASPSFNSISTTSSETGMQEIRQLSRGLARLENKPLAQQRYIPSEQKTDTMSKVSLGAKVERALSRRMTNQDYVMKEKPVKKTEMINEKAQVIVAAWSLRGQSEE